MKTQDEIILEITKQHLFFDDLETKNSDREDFREVAVWQLKKALEAAFKAGQDSKKEDR